MLITAVTRLIHGLKVPSTKHRPGTCYPD